MKTPTKFTKGFTDKQFEEAVRPYRIWRTDEGSFLPGCYYTHLGHAIRSCYYQSLVHVPWGVALEVLDIKHPSYRCLFQITQTVNGGEPYQYVNKTALAEIIASYKEPAE